jgi:hypothetical protein
LVNPVPDLFGALIIASALNETLMEKTFGKLSTGMIGNKGFVHHMLSALAVSLNFSITKVVPNDNGQWGAKNTDGSWSGMMGLLVDNKGHHLHHYINY